MAKTEKTPDWSRLKRIMVGDRVAVDQAGDHSHERLDHNTEGTVVGFGNEERTHLEVDFDGAVETLTEEELRVVPQ